MLSLYSPRQSVLTHPFFSSSDPFESIFGDRFDHFDLIPFNNNSNNVNSITMSNMANMSNMQVDLIEHDDGYQVKADLPGMKKEDITVNLNDKTNVLTISAEKKDEINQDTDTYKRRERYFGSVSRSIKLPKTSNLQAIQCGYEDGVLSLQVPKLPLVENKKEKENSHIKTIEVN